MEGLAAGQMRAARAGSVDVRNETPSAGPVGVVFGAKALAQQPLLSLDASEHDNKHQHGDQNADAGAERQPPTEREDEQAKVARVANDSVQPTGHQSGFVLDCNQAAEARPEHEDGRPAKNSPDGVSERGEPVTALAAEGEEIDPIRIVGHIGVDDSEDAKSGDHPAIGPIFPDARADMGLAEQP